MPHRGNVVALLNGGGAILEKYKYDAFGKPTVTNGAGVALGNASLQGNRFLFTGREWIAELGIYDYRHRLYHPGLGRFLQGDPLGLQTEGEKLSADQAAYFWAGGAPATFGATEMNLYRYCGNDPVNNSDPTGLDPVLVSPEANALAVEADSRNLTQMNANTYFWVISFEYSTTVYQDSQGKLSLSETRTDHYPREVRPPENPRMTSLVETHVHTFYSIDSVTKSTLSRPDVHRGNQTGRTQEVISPNGTRDRYRPSDNPEERKAGEGGVIERMNSKGNWERLKGANTDLKDLGGHRNGY